MDSSAFQTGLASWHDFYVSVGSASAALLGLLFVGVSINLSSIAVAKRADVRTRADVAFSNLLYLLCLSLIMLIPGVDSNSLAISLTAVAVVGLLRIVRRVVGLIGGRDQSWKNPATIRRFSWTVAADLVLLYVAASLTTRNDAIPLYYVTFVVFVLLVGAADVAWGLLVEESAEAPRKE